MHKSYCATTFFHPSRRPLHYRFYWRRPAIVRSRLSSRCMLCRGGDVLLVSLPEPRRVLRDRLNLAMSSPNTSPVRNADMRSSNSPFVSLRGSMEFLRPKFLATEFMRPSLFLRSMVRFFSCGVVQNKKKPKRCNFNSVEGEIRYRITKGLYKVLEKYWAKLE